MTDQSPSRHFLRPELVIDGFAAHCQFDASLLRQNEDKTRSITQARQQLMWLLRDLTPASQETIGKLLRRDQSTVWEGIKRVSDQMAADDLFRQSMKDARSACIRWATRSVSAVPSHVGDGRGVFARVIAAKGVLDDANLSDADARLAARAILSGLTQVEAQHG